MTIRQRGLVHGASWKCVWNCPDLVEMTRVVCEAQEKLVETVTCLRCLAIMTS